MPRKIKQYKNPFLSAKVPLVVPVASALPNLQHAITLHQQGKLEQAEVKYRQLLEIDPTNADAFNLLGVTARQTGKYQLAVGLISQAIKINPNIASYYSSLGLALQGLKQLTTAVVNYDKAIALKPEFAEAYSNRGNALRELKQLRDAVASYDKSIELKPDLAEPHYNRGIALQELNLLEEAVASYAAAISLKPKYFEAFCNRGIALQELKQLDAAVASYNQAIELKPDLALAYYNRGNALQELKQLDEAVASYDLAFKIDPDLNNLLGMMQNAKMFICDWDNFSENISILESAIARKKPATSPFVPLILFDKPELHILSARVFTESKYPTNHVLGKITKRNAGGKVRLGYFSADMYYHPVAIWLAELIDNHDKTKFELFGFSFRSNIKDPMSARIESAFDHFIEVDKMSDLEVATLARQLGIDIAIDLGGYSAESRTGIFALKAAPIQVSHIGFPSSMGAEFIDYFISDEHAIPSNYTKYYSEKIAYVPCAYTYDRHRNLSPHLLSRAEFDLPDNAFVFTCQNGCQKFTPEVFGIWMEILKSVPGSVLWLIRPHKSALVNLIKEARARGVESDRLVFTKRETVAVDQEQDRIARYLASYKLADLFLDTWPYNAGTTAVDALWAGLPVLTKAGSAFVARLAMTALHAIRVPELITNTAKDYQDLAVQLASDPQKLKLIKDKLQENRLTTSLFDADENSRYIEEAYTKMYERHQADLPPDHIYIGDVDSKDKT